MNLETTNHQVWKKIQDGLKDKKKLKYVMFLILKREFELMKMKENKFIKKSK